MWYRFSKGEVHALLNLALSNLVACAADYDANRAKDKWHVDRADFLTAARIVAELHAPAAQSAPTEYNPRNVGHGGDLHLSIDDDMREAASAEGVDVERELSGFDARANDPKCVHGRKRSEACEECAATTGAYAHKIAPHEQAALDAALIERNQALRDFGEREVSLLTGGWLKPVWSAGDGRCNWVNESTELRCVGDEGHPGSHQIPELERVRTAPRC